MDKKDLYTYQSVYVIRPDAKDWIFPSRCPKCGAPHKKKEKVQSRISKYTCGGGWHMQCFILEKQKYKVGGYCLKMNKLAKEAFHMRFLLVEFPVFVDWLIDQGRQEDATIFKKALEECSTLPPGN